MTWRDQAACRGTDTETFFATAPRGSHRYDHEEAARDRESAKRVCRECTEADRKGYCAPLRCYCGHQTCPAYASWREPVAPDITLREVAKASAWTNREEPTWIDQM